jgi:hypothetical protein
MPFAYILGALGVVATAASHWSVCLVKFRAGTMGKGEKDWL